MSKISFEGIGEVVATFGAKTGLKDADPVKVTANGEAGPCAAGERFCGVALAVEKNLAAVQVGGFAGVTTSGVVGNGWVKLAADGAGGVKVVTSGGAEYLVVDSDDTAHIATVLL